MTAITHLLRSVKPLLPWLIPHYCILCGERVEDGMRLPSVPLCGRCGSAMSGTIGRRCGTCGRELYSEEGTCYACRETSHSFSEAYPLFKYRKMPADLLRRYKADKRFSLAPYWAALMAGVIDEHWPGRAIVPVPPRPEKVRRKEWDQIEAVAKELERLGYRVLRCMERGASLQQKRLDREGRKANAEKAYTVKPSWASRLPATVILIDDVLTTGATVEACAMSLKRGGVADVAVLVIAAD